jgi:hypothetical protein
LLSLLSSSRQSVSPISHIWLLTAGKVMYMYPIE